MLYNAHMNGIGLYNLMRRLEADNGWTMLVYAYANPLVNHPRLVGVQFTDARDNVLGQLDGEAEQRMKGDPLSGPFYQLDVESLVAIPVPVSKPRWVNLSSVVRFNGDAVRSAPILVAVDAEVLEARVKEELPQMPYYTVGYDGLPASIDELVQAVTG